MRTQKRTISYESKLCVNFSQKSTNVAPVYVYMYFYENKFNNNMYISTKKTQKNNMIHLFIHISQDQNEDTEWNDALRRHNIIPQKEKEITEEDIVDLLEKTVEEKTQGNILI